MTDREETIREISQFFEITKLQNNEYQVTIKIDSGKFILRICFSREHPRYPPSLICANVMEHMRIDRFGTIKYPEYFEWTPTVNLVDIIKRLQADLNTNPPTKPKEKKFPEIESNVKAFAGRIKCEDDLIEVLRNTQEYKDSENFKIKMMNENKSLSNLILGKKKEFLERLKKNEKNLKVYQELVENFEVLHEKAEESNKHFRENVLIQSLNRIESYSVNQASKILFNFMQKRLELNDFMARYKEEVKTQKIVMMVKKI